MKNKKNKFEIDFIGGGRPLTEADTLEISTFIKNYKATHKKKLRNPERGTITLSS